MSLPTKLAVGTILGVGVFTTWSLIQTMNSIQSGMETIPQVSIHQLNWKGLTIRVDLTIKNPTKAQFSVGFPFLTLLYKGTTIGTSQSVNKEILVPAFGEARVEKILLHIPMNNVFSVVYTLIKSLYAKEPVMLTVKTATSIRIGRFRFTHKSQKEVALKN